MKPTTSIDTLKGNLFGAMTTVIVSLPLALAFGVASGAGAVAGLYGACALGLVAALLGGTPTQISGPTGPMTVLSTSIILVFVTLHPDEGLAFAFTTIMLGGLIQIAMGYFKLGRFINLIPYTVVSGFMSGIGIIIIFMQITAFLGSSVVAHHPLDVVKHFSMILDTADWDVLEIAIPMLLLLFMWPSSWHRWLPAPLAVLACTMILLGTVVDGSSFSRIGHIPSGLPEIYWPQFHPELIITMVKFAFVVAILGSVDTLLTSLIADSMTREVHDSNKELVGQGAGNMLAGFIGGLPGAGATTRTVLNIRSGGTTPTSGVIHAFLLIAILIFGGGLVADIPHFALAVILIKVGIDIIDWHFLARLRRAPLFSILIALSVIALTVFVDLILAVGVGVILSCLYTVHRLSQDQVAQAVTIFGRECATHLNAEEKKLLEGLNDHVLIYCLSGPLSFGAAKGLTEKFTECPEYDALILDMTDVSYLDVTTALAIEDMVKATHDADRLITLACSPQSKSMLTKMNVLTDICDHKIFDDRLSAIHSTQAHLIEQGVDLQR